MVSPSHKYPKYIKFLRQYYLSDRKTLLVCMGGSTSDNLKMQIHIPSKCCAMQGKHHRTQKIFSLPSSCLVQLNLPDDKSFCVLSPEMNWAPSLAAVSVVFWPIACGNFSC